MINQTLIDHIKEDISGGSEILLETATIEALKRLKDTGGISDQELENIYSTNFKNLVQGDTEDKNLLEIGTKLKSIENKLLTVYMEKNKEASEGSMVRNLIYRACSIDKNIGKNSKAKNIMKGVIDELMSIPELLASIINPSGWFQNAREFGKGIFDAFFKNFSQTMKSLKNAYTDAFQGTNTPEKAYNTGRSSMLIVLTLIPGAIGKSLLKVGKMVAKAGKTVAKVTTNAAKGVAKGITKAGKKAFPEATKVAGKKAVEKAAQNVAKKAPKNINNAFMIGAENAVKSSTRSALDGLGKAIKKPTDRVVRNTKNAGRKFGRLKESSVLVALAVDVMKLPVRMLNGTRVLLGKLIPKRLRLMFSKDLRNIAKLTQEIKRIEGLLANTKNAGRITRHNNTISRLKDQINQIKLNGLKNKLIGGGLIAVNEVDNIVNQITHEDYLKKIEELMNENNNKFTTINEETVNLTSGSTTISEDSLNYPQLENINRDDDSINKPVITITGLASKTGSYNANERISRQRAEQAKIIIGNKYNVPLNNIIIKTGIQPQDSKDDIGNRQGVKVEISGIPDPTYVEGYDKIKEGYINRTKSYDEINNINYENGEDEELSDTYYEDY